MKSHIHGSSILEKIVKAERMGMDYPKGWEKVTCRSWCEDEGRIWLCLRDKNAICEINKSDSNVKILANFPNNGLGENDLSLSVEKCGDFVVFSPFNANDIAVLNICTGDLRFINVTSFFNKDNYMSGRTEKFYRMVSYKDTLFFFGIRYPGILKLDTMTMRVDFFDGWLEEIERHKCKDAVFFTDGYARKGNELYLPIGRCSGMLKVNLDTMEWDYVMVCPTIRGILGMTQKENLVWFTEYEVESGSFFQWNLDNGEMTQTALPCRDAFYAPFYYDNSLMFFGNFGKKSYRYWLESGEWEEITDSMSEVRGSSDKKINRDEVVYYSSKGKMLYHWNPTTNTICYEDFLIKGTEFLEASWIDYCRQYRERLKRDTVYEDSMDIRNYIGIIRSGQLYNEGCGEEENQCGRRIWKMLMANER